MGRRVKNKHWFRVHARGWLTEYSARIAEVHGVSNTILSHVLNRHRACDRRLAEIIAGYSGGRAVEELFDLSNTRPPEEPAAQPFEDWRKWARLLRLALRRAGPADVEFVGTDGSFLRTLLCDGREPQGLGFPTPFPIRSLRVTMMSARRLQDLARARLVHPDRVKVARAYHAIFSTPGAARRADGTSVKIDFRECDWVPAVCGTRAGGLIVGGWSGFGPPGEDQLTVPNVLRIDRSRDPGVFRRWTDLLSRAADEART